MIDIEHLTREVDRRITRAVEIGALIQLRQEQVMTELDAIKSLRGELEKL